MGVLDDAIREHLELKRRHGAAEEEIARKEAEALGPARRGPVVEPEAAPPDPGALAAEPAPEPASIEAEPAPDPAVQPGDEPVPETEPPRPHGDPLAPAAHEPAEPVAETEPVPADEDVATPPHEPTIDVPAEPEPPAAIDGPAARPVEPVHDVDRDPLEPPPPMPGANPAGATVEFDTLSEPDEDAPPAEGDEDVLEETPEFLRETPEHDRLWFEQKPPRDFDLDN